MRGFNEMNLKLYHNVRVIKGLFKVIPFLDFRLDAGNLGKSYLSYMDEKRKHGVSDLNTSNLFTTAINGSYSRYPDKDRPQLLAEAEKGYALGEIPQKDYIKALERATVDVIAEVVTTGVNIACDGRLRASNAVAQILEELGGFKNVSPDVYNPRFQAVSPAKWIHPILLEDYVFIKDRSPIEIRPALMGPLSLALSCYNGSYGDNFNQLAIDIAGALNHELLELQDAGAMFILVEEPKLTINKDKAVLFEKIAERLCNNVRSSIILGTSGGDIVGLETMLRDSPFSGIALDMIEGEKNQVLFDNNFDWGEKIIQLGIIDSNREDIENTIDIAVRLIASAKVHPAAKIWVAPTKGMENIPRTVAFRKLTNMVQGAAWARQEIIRRGEN